MLLFPCLMLSAWSGEMRQLRKGFACPPESAQARTWWHWINGNVTADGITADLEAMKRAGVSEAQIFNVDQGFPEGDAEYMSRKWLRLFRFAAEEAGRLGISLGFNNAAGWSATGGPWVTPEYGMQKVVWSETEVDGDSRGRAELPIPEKNLGYYRDIAVLAFPSPDGKARIGKLEVKTLSGQTFENGLLPDFSPVPSSSVVDRSRILDLTALMNEDGVLDYDFPQGKWTVLRIGHTPTGVENRPANRTGRGLECDKMSRKAADVYWDGGIRPILDCLGDLVGTVVTNCLIDSYEVGCGNWTPGFRKEFRRIAGYDCIPYLATLAGYYVGSGEESERFLWDFRNVIGRLMEENYFGYLAGRFRECGMLCSIEPYGGPFDCLDAGAAGDIPMGEFWVGTKSMLSTSKLASSVANINGLPFTGAESFTADSGHSKWLNHPATLKALGDWAWTEGVNRFIFHSYTHQPWDVVPGMTFHGYGTEFSRHNTWWEPGRAYMSYIARSQYLLQQGRMAADVLVFVGESSPEDGLYRPDIKDAGYDYDEISASGLQSLYVKDGMLCTPAGGRYSVLLLTDSGMMTSVLAEKIAQLADSGACIVGPEPALSPSLADMGEGDRKVKKIAERLWNNGLVKDIPVLDALALKGTIPDFSGNGLRFVHRTMPGIEIYFVSNPEKRFRTEKCRFRVSGKTPECWDPMTGKISGLPVWTVDGPETEVEISFGPEDSFFIVFSRDGGRTEGIVSVEENVEKGATLPLHGLRILKAEYGYFLPEEVSDVTSVLCQMAGDGVIGCTVSNDLFGDPAPGVVKELRVMYMHEGKMRLANVKELQSLNIRTDENVPEKGTFQAFYGNFPEGFDGFFRSSAVDITEKVKEMLHSGVLEFTPGKVLDYCQSEGIVSCPGNRLHLVYTVSGERFDILADDGDVIDLRMSQPSSTICLSRDKLVWKTPYEGRVSCTMASGKRLEASVDRVLDPVSLSGAWDVFFQENRGAPASVVMDSLYSWTESMDDGIRYFSGTAVYVKEIVIPKEYFGKGKVLELDLGNVKVIAEVKVNGNDAGILWKEPFKTDITGLLHPGDNRIEIKVTNLWPNRLIGDAAMPEDCDWGDWTLSSWPVWLESGRRNSDRVTFTTWRHWGKDDSLLPSGLLGPVVLVPYVEERIK